ncbi:hypothetical protein LHGZ1_0006 [Laribacter hongkongensis]|uniref:Uncharacterized protein n=1 Tax=Laribacter hongkongensis TaxID=168471 RepID=A0A248LDP8_9NEIS|nr:hypothetical protein LHGZ1_0006 [Laribacter hongkongensis]
MPGTLPFLLLASQLESTNIRPIRTDEKMPARISPSDRKNHRTSLNQLQNPVY